MRATLALHNLFGRTFVDRPDGCMQQGDYGEPRSLMATLSCTY